MALENVQTSIAYQGTGRETIFSVPFPVLDKTHLAVHMVAADTGGTTLLTPGADYQASLDGGSGTGAKTATVTLVKALAEGSRLIVARIVPLTQENIFHNQGPNYARVVEDSLDKLTMIAQQLSERQDAGDAEASELRSEIFKLENADAQLRNGVMDLNQSKADRADLQTVAGTLKSRDDELQARIAGLAKDKADRVDLQDVAGTLKSRDYELQIQINGKAATGHAHGIANVTGLQAALDAKATTTALASTVGALTAADTDLQTQITGKAATGHTHGIASVTGLQAALDAKADAIALASAIGTLAAKDNQQQARIDSLASLKADKAEVDSAVAALATKSDREDVAAIAEQLRTEAAGMMQAAPADGRFYLGVGRSWYPVSFAAGEPFAFFDGGVSPVLRPAYASDFWNEADGGWTLKAAVSGAAASDCFFLASDGVTLKGAV